MALPVDGARPSLSPKVHGVAHCPGACTSFRNRANRNPAMRVVDRALAGSWPTRLSARTNGMMPGSRRSGGCSRRALAFAA